MHALVFRPSCAITSRSLIPALIAGAQVCEGWGEAQLGFLPLPHPRVREERRETHKGDFQHSAAQVVDLRVLQSGRVMPVLLRFEISCIKCKGLEADIISGGAVGDCEPEV